MKISKPITTAIDQSSRYIVILKENRDVFLKDGFLKKSSFENRTKYFTELASAEAILWGLIRKEYPESEGKFVAVTANTVEWEDIDLLTPSKPERERKE